MLTLGNLPDRLPAWLPVELTPFIPSLGLQPVPYVAKVDPQPDGTFRRLVARADLGRNVTPTAVGWIPDKHLPPTGFVYTVGKHKDLPVWDAPVHYLVWYAGEIVYSRYRQMDADSQAAYRPDFLRLCDHLERWAAMLFTADRLSSAKKNIAQRKSPYFARNPISHQLGNSAVLMRLDADAGQRTTPPTDFDLQISVAVAELLDMEDFSWDNLPTLERMDAASQLGEVDFWGN